MAAYNVSYHLRHEIKGLSASAEEETHPDVVRVSASTADRAISKVVNELKNLEVIGSKADIKVLEAKIVG